MPDTILITGSNRGIGLELCKQYAQLGWQVHACCRQPENATALSNLISEYSNIEIHSLDVTNTQQITNLAKSLESVSIDILINNAGIYGQGDSSFGHTDEDKWLKCFRVNTIAPLKVMECFVNHVASSQHKIMASMSSKMGSMDDNGSGGCYDY